ncbi:MAG: hypothetical protein ACOC2S_01355 [Halanaerobium sp.]
MDKHDYHFISIKFLTAILLALFFAFLFIYVFSPQQRDDYSVYSLEKKSIDFSAKKDFFDFDLMTGEKSLQEEKLNFEKDLRAESFKLMEESKQSLLAVISANYLEQMNGLREEKLLELEAERRELDEREESLLQGRREELEAQLSEQLQQLRQEVRDKYSDFNQQQIRANYLKMINLELKIEFVARSESEREEYQKELEQLRLEQESLVDEKNSQLNSDISDRTGELIMEFNQQYSGYRDRLKEEHSEIIAEKREKIENELAAAREEIKSDLASAREAEAVEIDNLIKNSREKYY